MPPPNADELAHLNDDAPHLVCDRCGRHSGADVAYCNMPQPDGSRCPGVFARPAAPTDHISDGTCDTDECGEQRAPGSAFCAECSAYYARPEALDDIGGVINDLNSYLCGALTCCHVECRTHRSLVDILAALAARNAT